MSGKSLVFNALVVSLNAIGGFSAGEVMQKLSDNAAAVDTLISLGSDINCFQGDPPSFRDIDNCVAAVDSLFGDPLFNQLVKDIAQQLGQEVTDDQISTVFARFGLLSNIADAVAYVYTAMRYQNGTFFNEYILTPVTFDPSLLPPWNPRLITPRGTLDDIPTSFQWEIAGGANYYNLQVSDNPEFTSPLIEVTLTGLDFEAPPLFDFGHTYYWRVRAINQAGASAWSDAEFTIEALEGPSPEPVLDLLDLIFVIDTTGSMEDDINEVKREAINIINEIAASSASWQIGIVTYRDHPIEPYGESTDYVARIELEFSTDREEIVSAINTIRVGGGADFEEAVYSGIMTAIGFPWRDGAKKALIIMGDAPPHDPEPVTGFTLSSTLQAAFDVDPANIYTLMIADDENTRISFQSLADGSSGRLFRAATAQDVVDTVLATVESIAYEPELSRLLVIGGLARVNTSGIDRLNLRSGPGLEYAVVDKVPFGTTVTVLGGPEFGAPYLWWNIETPWGVSGWSVEASDGLVTLIPILDEEPAIPIVAFPPIDRQEAIRSYTSIWSLVEFQDIREPSEVTYQIEVDAARVYRLAFSWCGDTSNRLREILEPLTVEFLVNDILLTDTHILRSNLDGVCDIWETILSGWNTGEEYQIVIHYSLSESIFDGSGNYAAGDYYQKLLVTAR